MKLKLITRVLTVFYITYITLFIFDEPILSLDFIIHLIPTIIFSFFFAVSFKKQKVGGILFVLTGLLTIFMLDTYKNIFSLFTVSIIPIIIGILFIIERKQY
jgi:uncharacterized membrane protein YjjB (DUF3815 family)